MSTAHVPPLLLFLLLAVLPAPPAMAACDGPEHAGFDFWLGEWEIAQRFLDPVSGSWIELPARTSVEKVLAGCAILERWSGQVIYPWAGMTAPAPLEGLSVRAWDPTAKAWRIQWMDSMQPSFGDGVVGTIADGHGIFAPEEPPASGRWSRIVFARRGPDRVDWRLETTRDGGETWLTVWEMEMRSSGAAATSPTATGSEKAPSD